MRSFVNAFRRFFFPSPAELILAMDSHPASIHARSRSSERVDLLWDRARYYADSAIWNSKSFRRGAARRDLEVAAQFRRMAMGLDRELSREILAGRLDQIISYLSEITVDEETSLIADDLSEVLIRIATGGRDDG